jgi:hypothetical protein
MKYLVAIVGALVIFIASGILLGILLFFICPRSWWETYLNLGLLSANVPSLIAFVIATLAAAHSFRASIRIKTKK